MNELSWLIYLADVAGQADGMAITGMIAATAVACFCVISWGVYAAMAAMEAYSDDAEREKCRAIAKGFLRPVKLAGTVLVVSAVICALTPSKATLYAIAASEMGEQVLTSETGSKATQALNAWLDRQIAGAPKEEPAQ